MASQGEDPDVAGHHRGDTIDNAPETGSTTGPDGRWGWLKNPAIVVALITVAGGVLVAVINRGGSTQDPEQAADAKSPSSPSVLVSSASTGTTTSSSPEGSSSASQGSPQSGKWVVEDEAVSVSASYEPFIFPYGGSTFLMPSEGVAPRSWPSQLDDPEGYARDHGGQPAGVAAVQLVVRAKTDDPVVVTSIVPRVVDRLLTSSAGYAVKIHYGCGGIPIRSVLADLDAEPVKIQYDEGRGGGLIDRMALKVTPDDPEVVVVQRDREDRECRVGCLDPVRLLSGDW
jgi:hypothetical protein